MPEKSLNDYFTEMVRIAHELRGDPETQHWEKDKLLAALVRDHLGEEGADIANLYTAMGGWYA